MLEICANAVSDRPPEEELAEPVALAMVELEESGSKQRGLEPPHVRVPLAAVMTGTAQDVPRSQILGQIGYG